MPTIPPRFQSLLSVTSPGGPKATADELDEVLLDAPVSDVQAFASRGIDTCADTAAITRVAERIGLDAVPKQLGRLSDHAAGRAWKNGDFALQRHLDGAPREAVVLLQRALLKIGAHHPDGAALSSLLQLPYGADGDLGPRTLAALNTAMSMAGRPDLALHSAATPVSAEVAVVIDTLLAQTPALVHPTLLNAPTSTPTPTPAPDSAAAGPSLDAMFGQIAVPLSSNTMGKWAELLPRIDAERHRYDGGSGDDLPPAAHYWREHLDDAMGQPVGYQLSAVNALVNGWLYDSDQALYGEADKWATPLEFLTRQRGDCEDYVICKYESLRRLGVPEDDMRLVTVEDRASGVAHMILVVKHDGELHVLDNQHRLVEPPEQLTLADGTPRYRPLYAMNRNGTWLFGSPVTDPT